jgi:hypothetical protein
MKPLERAARSIQWRLSPRMSCRADVLPPSGSGVAAKQYDPGAPFFIGHQSSVVGHQTLLETKTLLSKPEKGHSDRRLTTDD